MDPSTTEGRGQTPIWLLDQFARLVGKIAELDTKIIAAQVTADRLAELVRDLESATRTDRDYVSRLENRVQFLESTVKDLDSCFARLDEKYEELSQAVGRLEPPAEIPQAVRECVKEAEPSGRQSISIPPAIQREVEEVIAERRGEQPPAKRREWWVWRRKKDGWTIISDKAPDLSSPHWEVVRVIEAPTEAEIEAAICDLMFYTGRRSDIDKARVKAAIRKLLGGGE
jgi:uncharacterized protein YdcH (DUF465 family)